MPLALTLCPCLLLIVAPMPTAEAGGGLPAGNDAAFRDRMMDWSAAQAPPILNAPLATLGLPRLSSRFGVREDPFHAGHALHKGIDIPGALGSAVRAADAGTVRFAGVAGGYGNLVEIVHAGNLESRYGHLSRLLVHDGERVERGEVIALMGSSGRSTGSHLHFEVRLNGQAVDPLGMFGAVAQSEGTASPAAAPSHISAFARARDRAAAVR
ncbi:M23 family metallopeptidase [Sphingomonas sp. TF3]|jgi:murein DD-endopeptidase MepM/ murein hydrolase activator NlpD|uniref:M23 family metallopeptidase n=1 Tax=unclassified Sphingomonas TaxID=196159 RepID=UPI000F86B0CF|nr:M23 family metallopeptidase [Sphingomonas sp. TF3]